uniref:Uncharacterized protein n=1 Tax=Oryza glaberrima TaxID=4538 RepID=I1PCW1_ORYGL
MGGGGGRRSVAQAVGGGAQSHSGGGGLPVCARPQERRTAAVSLGWADWAEGRKEKFSAQRSISEFLIQFEFGGNWQMRDFPIYLGAIFFEVQFEGIYLEALNKE